MEEFVRLDQGTVSEILYLAKNASASIEELSELFGIPEALVSKILM